MVRVRSPPPGTPGGGPSYSGRGSDQVAPSSSLTMAQPSVIARTRSSSRLTKGPRRSGGQPGSTHFGCIQRRSLEKSMVIASLRQAVKSASLRLSFMFPAVIQMMPGLRSYILG